MCGMSIPSADFTTMRVAAVCVSATVFAGLATLEEPAANPPFPPRDPLTDQSQLVGTLRKKLRAREMAHN